jgi:NAD(P)-dependent dehydrogenase (short-subunit alcohol dehydrogenase family)
VTTLFDLTGKVAVITGSSRGIGRAIAERMAEHGAKVVVSSRKLDACEEVAAGVRERGGQAVARTCHVGRREDLQALVDATLAEWGQIDVLVCNAAINPYYGPSIDLPESVFDQVINVNLKSIFLMCNMVIPQMAARGEGSIICISALGGLIGSDVLGIYAITKAAEMQLMRNLAVEWGRQGIRANTIAPGLIRTDFAKALWSNPELLAKRTADVPLGGIGMPDDIAGAAVFLASKAAAFMTGQTMVIDGGRYAGSPTPPRAADDA